VAAIDRFRRVTGYGILRLLRRFSAFSAFSATRSASARAKTAASSADPGLTYRRIASDFVASLAISSATRE